MRALVIIASLAAGAVTVSGQSARLREIHDAASYAVYGAVLKLDAEARDLSGVHLREWTVTRDDCMSSGERLPPGWGDVLADYRARNRAPSKLLEGMNLPVGYVLLSNEEVEGITTAWLQWVERTQGAEVTEPMPPPTHFFEVSAVGFDAPRQRALVYVAHHCGFNCAGGQHWLLERRDGEWVQFTTQTECSWIAD